MPPHRKGGTVWIERGGGDREGERERQREINFSTTVSAEQHKRNCSVLHTDTCFELREPQLSLQRPTGGGTDDVFGSEGEK